MNTDAGDICREPPNGHLYLGSGGTLHLPTSDLFLFYLAAAGLSFDIMESLLWHVRLCTALQYVGS